MKFKDKRYISFSRENNEDVLFKTFNLADLGFNEYDYIVVNARIDNENKLSIKLNEDSKRAIDIMGVPEENVKLLLKSIRTYLNEHNLVIFEEIQRPQYNNQPRIRRNLFEEYDINGIDLNQYQNIMINNVLKTEDAVRFRNIFIDNLNRLNNENEIDLRIKKCIVWMLHEQVNNGTVRYFNEERNLICCKGHRISNYCDYGMINDLGIDPNFGIYSDVLADVYGVIQLPFNNQINYTIVFEDNIFDY